MKSNEAPEKIYVHIRYKPCEITFSEVKEKGVSNIEYTRTDAFVDKAVEWITNNCYIPHSTLENFRNYMKGE